MMNHYHYAQLSGEQVAELDRLQNQFNQSGKQVVLLAVEQPCGCYAKLDSAALNKLTALEKELSGKEKIALVAYAADHCGCC